MKRIAITCLLFVSVCAWAQQRAVSVRLFWQHPPEKIRVEGQGGVQRACSKCPAKAIASPFEVSARTSSTVILEGRARISGLDFAPFTTDGELTVEPRDGALLLTLKMPLEDYVAAVLTGESAGFKSEEALKAMAVAARTYAIHFDSRHKPEGFDFCDTTHCQDVRLGNESARVRNAVAATEGEVLWFEGRPAATYYHRSCGGELEDARKLDPELRAPYLRRHQDTYCAREEWHAEILKSDLGRALGYPVTGVKVAQRSDSGRVETVVLNGRPVSATNFRLTVGRALGWDKVRSDLYELEDRGDRVAFRGRGQGHGVGLCQSGADAMGQQGKSYREILSFYYPGTRLGINAQGLAWQKFSGASVDVISTSQSDAASLLTIAEQELQVASERTTWSFPGRAQIRVYPNIAAYRDATGEPGWVAASTRGNVIRLQPLLTLQRTGSLASTLRHEFLHMMVEENADGRAPLWLREGLVIYLSDPAAVKPIGVEVASLDADLRALQNRAASETEIRSAYRKCGSAVADNVRRFGLAKVLNWVKSGVAPQ